MWPPESLSLLQALEGLAEADAGMLQQVSASVFGDSKHLGRTAVLKRIWNAWLKTQPSRGEMRIKAFSPTVHERAGLNLQTITQVLGSALLDAHAAQNPHAFVLSGISQVVTSENLAPFRQLALEQGLLIYSQGYASRSLADWLAAMPEECTWVHFGDLDADGLHIFEDLIHKSGRQGRFAPDPAAAAALLPSGFAWKGARPLHPDKYCHPVVSNLAREANALNIEVEQETITAACVQHGQPLSAIGLDGAQLRRYSAPPRN